MNLSISNIAWTPEYDDDIVEILKHKNINFIDLAPSLYQDINRNFNITKFHKVKEYWSENNISFYSMQSLLYGLEKFSLFNEKNHNLLLDHLNKIVQISNVLGIKNLIFGSPKNRIYTLKTQEDNYSVAINFFSKVSLLLEETDITLSIEPNPSVYGADFINNSEDCFNFISQLNKPNIKTHLDLGAVQLNKENLKNLLINGSEYINSIHISEPYLKTIKNSDFHTLSSKLIRKFLNLEILSIEISSNHVRHLDELEDNIDLVKSIYISEKY
jgi:D-psicose/D-tagatose/L-ribulose 3-epimerase